MNKTIRDKLLHTCAWCTQTIKGDTGVYGFGAKARPGVDLSDKEGQFVTMTLALSKKTIIALVPTHFSTAKAEGYDLVFMTCSQECAQELKEALEFERDVFEVNP